MILSGAAITNLGYYGPFVLFSTVLGSIGAGLITTFTVHTAHPSWIGFQVLFGAGLGTGFQLALVIVQAALPAADVPIATAMMIFAQTLGGSLFVSVAQNVFSNLLKQRLMKTVPDVSATIVTSTGATELRNVIDKVYLPDVLTAYNYALTHTFYVAAAMCADSIIGVVAIDWRISVKQKPVDTVAA
jgi:hypothetical protein